MKEWEGAKLCCYQRKDNEMNRQVLLLIGSSHRVGLILWSELQMLRMRYSQSSY